MKAILMLFFSLIQLNCLAQINNIFSRKIFKSENTIVLEYVIMHDSLKGFFVVEEEFNVALKFVAKKANYACKISDNRLVISGDKLVKGESIKCIFKMPSQLVYCKGKVVFENYPNAQIDFIFPDISIEPLTLIANNTNSNNSDTVKRKGYKSKPIDSVKNVVFQRNNSVYFRVQLAASTTKMDKDRIKTLSGLSTEVYEEKIDGYFKYTIGNESSLEDVTKLLSKVYVQNFKKPFIVAYSQGTRISVNEAVLKIKASQ